MSRSLGIRWEHTHQPPNPNSNRTDVRSINWSATCWLLIQPTPNRITCTFLWTNLLAHLYAGKQATAKVCTNRSNVFDVPRAREGTWWIQRRAGIKWNLSDKVLDVVAFIQFADFIFRLPFRWVLSVLMRWIINRYLTLLLIEIWFHSAFGWVTKTATTKPEIRSTENKHNLKFQITFRLKLMLIFFSFSIFRNICR